MSPPRSRSGAVATVFRRALTAAGRLFLGLVTGMLALVTAAATLAVTASCLIGVGWFLVRPWLRVIRAVADLERRRLARFGEPVPSPYGPLPTGIAEGFHDPSIRRDLVWLVSHGVAGSLVCLIGFQFPVNAVREATAPLWWTLLPPEEAGALNGLVQITSWREAFIVAATSPVWLALWLVVSPRIADFQARWGRRMLRPHPGVDLSARVSQLTASRAAALDAHAAELRRIERALHDGAQNRLVAVAMLTGAARQVVRRDPEQADPILERVQDAAEQALAELRTVVRSILPPVLENRGLAGALSALGADCAVPCTVTVDVTVRCAAGVESTAYFVVAEALTNVSRHSGANESAVTVRRTGDVLRIEVRDDGRGGAAAGDGSGLTGIVRRVEAHDGTARIDSPVGGPTLVEVELPCG
ncbi:signal transduction histidine kinase [Stackebrandtia albiflava]|uniref:histidine kinase n=1 Tax=Stackebrandtia albiflava TaxID=406432 RepID=A0A562VEH3_9ACTN|nr:sensor histidine kinase [Stackebrandtia albiflava]TWJ16289.1 signal transduction histidine kinase [Stackebrandtia albiflava]